MRIKFHFYRIQPKVNVYVRIAVDFIEILLNLHLILDGIEDLVELLKFYLLAQMIHLELSNRDVLDVYFSVHFWYYQRLFSFFHVFDL